MDEVTGSNTGDQHTTGEAEPCFVAFCPACFGTADWGEEGYCCFTVRLC